jgi:hypothetical protein
MQLDQILGLAAGAEQINEGERHLESYVSEARLVVRESWGAEFKRR